MRGLWNQGDLEKHVPLKERLPLGVVLGALLRGVGWGAHGGGEEVEGAWALSPGPSSLDSHPSGFFLPGFHMLIKVSRFLSFNFICQASSPLLNPLGNYSFTTNNSVGLRRFVRV